MKKNKNKGGRRSYEGARHTYHVADDAHEYIKKHGGGQWLTDVVRVIKATEKGGNNGTD